MDKGSEFKKIAFFLSQYQDIWSVETLSTYSEGLEKYYPIEWMDTICNLSDDECFELEARKNLEVIKGTELEKFFIEARELAHIPFHPDCPKIENRADYPIDHFAFINVVQKKKHEVLILGNVIKDLQIKNNFRHIVDIGGGVGYLAQMLATYFHLPMISIDQDEKLQITGIERNKKNARDGIPPVRYINYKIDDDNQKIKDELNSDALVLGIHSCGDLSVQLIKSCVEFQSKMLLNFGCCYYRLAAKSTYNISKFAKENGITLSAHSLTLAARSHGKLNRKDYEYKNKVKRYRYALHILLCETFKMNHVATLGNGHKKLYEGPFTNYANEMLGRLKLGPLPEKDLDEFYNRQATQENIRRMILAGTIRMQFGRVIEKYLLLDRCLYLEENNYHTELNQYFNEDLSPRNCGILAIFAC